MEKVETSRQRVSLSIRILPPSHSHPTLSPETKLLKTGRKISLGRKEQPLLVVNKKISRENCQFTVGLCTPDDIVRFVSSFILYQKLPTDFVLSFAFQLDPSFIPTLEIFNAKEKPMTIERESQALIVNPSSSYSLKSGDKIIIVVGIIVE